MGFDTIVVGGGSAGCALAARLSEDPDHAVLLVEAGPDYADLASLPPDVADASVPTFDHDWGYTADATLDRGMALPRARLMGGCSATNACFALRGAPAVYDAWAGVGNQGWSFDDLLPHFRRLEADGDFDDAWHGDDGPIPIRRHPRSEWSAAQAAFLDGAIAAGHAYCGDHNRPDALGVGPAPRNIRDGIRMSTALTYLAGARGRANLTIRADTMTARVACTGGRARGIELVGGEVIEADRVVLAAGTYASPTLLARSGIGPADQLGALGVTVVAPLSGVGEHLVDHPLIGIDLPARPDTPCFQTVLTFHSSAAARDDPPDLMLFASGPWDAPPDDVPSGAVFAIVAALMAPRSEGWVRLRSADPEDPPHIHVGHLRDPHDLARMLESVVEARRLARTEPMAAVLTGPELAPGPVIADEGLVAWLRAGVSTFHHPVGTCAMGPDPDAGAVVDARGAVHGVDGLYVADASIMPTIPNVPTNLASIMVAERIASGLREG